nr:fructosamine kinase family protein [Cellulomonas gilvus]
MRGSPGRGYPRAQHRAAGRGAQGQDRPVFRKQRADAPAGFFRCEAAGLAWLRAAGAVPVVRVLDAADDHLDLERLTPVPPTRAAAAAFGRGLARLHAAGAPAFGSPAPGWVGDGWFGPLDHPLPLASGSWDRWGELLAEGRLRPLGSALRGVVPQATLDALARVADQAEAGRWDDDEPPARLHGDLWAGNVLWTSLGATLIDPAAHGGHRETDLAMLALFGFPFLDDVLRGYQDEHPLRAGWQRRTTVHQVFPVGVHALLFGGPYVAQLARLLAPLA